MSKEEELSIKQLLNEPRIPKDLVIPTGQTTAAGFLKILKEAVERAKNVKREEDISRFIAGVKEHSDRIQ
jgi:hypothetical protein